MGTVELTFEYKQSEYVKAERQYLFASKTITKTSVVVLGIFMFFSVFYLPFSSFSVLSIIGLAVSLLALAMGCILYFYMPIQKFKNTSKYHEEYNLLFSKLGIRFKTSTINSELQWDIYSEIWESDDFYFLIQAPRIYTLIPKRVFQSAEDNQAFKEMATSRLKCVTFV